MDIQPLSRALAPDNSSLSYGDGAVFAFASPIPPLRDDNYDDVSVTAISVMTDGQPAQRSPLVIRCPGENPDNPDDSPCNECRLTTGCNPGPPPPQTQMRHLRIRKAAATYDNLLSRIDLGQNIGGPILTFPGVTSIPELLAALWNRVGGPKPGVVFQIYRLETWRTLVNVPVGTYIAVPSVQQPLSP